jgi:hypothetical protein
LTSAGYFGTLHLQWGEVAPEKEKQMATMITSTSKEFELPEDGSYLAVLADVIMLGPCATAFGIKNKVQVVWLLDAYDSEGYQFRVSNFYNESLHENATLRKDLNKVMGTDVGTSFDADEAIGIVNQLVVQQSKPNKEGKVFANVVAILRAPAGATMELPADFERKIDRDGVGSSENPVNTAPGKKAPVKAKPQQAPQPTQQRPQPQQRAAAQNAPNAGPVRATAPVRATRPATVPAQIVVPAPVEEVYYEEAAVEEAPAPVQAPPQRAVRAVPTIAPTTGQAPQRAGTIRRAAPAPVQPVAEAPITDEDIPF